MDAVYSVIDSLQSNPDETLVGKAIAAAKRKLDSGEENWAAIMTVCDLTNSTEQGPRDAVRAIRKQLQAQQDWQTVSTMMSIIEALTKNCGRRFHLQLTNRAFLREIRLLLINGQREAPSEQSIPIDLQKRILGMIQCWAYVFRSDKRFKPVKDLYSELLAHDFDFPDLKSSVSLMPAEAIEAEGVVSPAEEGRDGRATNPTKVFDSLKARALNFVKGPLFVEPREGSADRVEFRAGTFLTPHQIAKLRSEISVVCEHVNILNQIIDSFQPEGHSTKAPGDHHNSDDATNPASDVAYRRRDLELMDRLYDVCGEMHSRILDIIGLVDEELLAQMLSLIDEMNNVFARYLDFRREHLRVEGQVCSDTGGEPAQHTDDVRAQQLLDLS